MSGKVSIFHKFSAKCSSGTFYLFWKYLTTSVRVPKVIRNLVTPASLELNFINIEMKDINSRNDLKTFCDIVEGFADWEKEFYPETTEISSAVSITFSKKLLVAIEEALKYMGEKSPADFLKQYNTCPCCGYKTITDHETICSICCWEIDEIEDSRISLTDQYSKKNNSYLSEAQQSFIKKKRAHILKKTQSANERDFTKVYFKDPFWRPL